MSGMMTPGTILTSLSLRGHFKVTLGSFLDLGHETRAGKQAFYYHSLKKFLAILSSLHTSSQTYLISNNLYRQMKHTIIMNLGECQSF